MFHSSMIMMMMIRRSLNKIYFEDLAKAFRKLLIQLLPHKTDQKVFYLLCPSPSRYFAWFGLFARSSSIASLNITILKQACLNIPISKQDFLNIPILKQTSLNITKMKQHVKNVTGKKNRNHFLWCNPSPPHHHQPHHHPPEGHHHHHPPQA